VRRDTAASDIDRLIDALYAAATDEPHWDGFLGHLARATGSETAHLQFHDETDGGGAILHHFGIGPEAAKEYLTWGAENVYVQASLPYLQTGAVIRSPIERSRVLESAFYREFVSRHARVCDTAGVCVVRSRDAFAFVSVLRAVGARDYGPDEEALLRRLVPHLQRAFEVQRRLAEVDLERAATAEVLDRLPTGVFLLGEDRRVLFENTAARRIVARGDALTLTRESRLTTIGPLGRRPLERAVAEACRTMRGSERSGGAAFRLERSEGRPAYGVVVSPLAVRVVRFLSRRPAAVVLVGDPDRPVPPEVVLREMFGLTGAQSALVALLGAGESLDDAAEKLGVTRNTARWTLKQVFVRTGVTRQSELMRLLDALPSQAATGPEGPSGWSATASPTNRRLG